MNDYEREIWESVVRNAELDVMCLISTRDGFKPGESVEDYAARARIEQDNALARLAFARAKLKEVEEKP